jgi:hypothetical protein
MDSKETITPIEETTDSAGELSHSDKMIGILTEPSETFSITSKFPPRTKDWVIPIFLLLLITSVVQIILSNNEEIAFQAKMKQMEKIETQYDEAVSSGAMTRDQANEQLDRIADQMDQGRGAVGMIIQTVSIFIVGFIIFFLFTGIYFLFSKTVFKGEGVYASALVANGLVSYITIIHVVVAAVLSILLGRLIPYIDLTALLGVERASIQGFLFGKVDVFAIWINIVLGIGLAKMFRSSSNIKYILMVFGVWIAITLIFYLLAQVIPFLQFFMQ